MVQKIHNYANISVIMFICLERKCTIFLQVSVTEHLEVCFERVSHYGQWELYGSNTVHQFEKLSQRTLIWLFMTYPCKLFYFPIALQCGIIRFMNLNNYSLKNKSYPFKNLWESWLMVGFFFPEFLNISEAILNIF